MIEVGKSEPRLYISQYMFSTINSEVRRQVLWCQYIAKDGKLMGIGRFRLLKSSYMQDRIRKMRTDYLKRMKKDVSKQ